MNAPTHTGGDFAALARRAHREFTKVSQKAGDECMDWDSIDAAERMAWVAAVRHVVAEVVALGAPANEGI